ncbi:hypothetical protein EDB85DRAFT_417747 [Lactarius pseudohatsudake]|nr:hypothetical protein EDB85DRAFT_417747 [Lactarius pseudohatsudake]
MPLTYPQLIKLALTDAAKEGMESFSLSWLRQRIRTHARKAKKRLGPQLNKSIECVIRNEAQLGYLDLRLGRRSNVASIYLSAGGRHEYSTLPTTAITIEAQGNSAANTRKELRQENEKLRSELLKMEIRLARANSFIDIENSDHAEVVTGAPTAIMERIQRLVVLSKNRKHQVSLILREAEREAEQYRYNVELLNGYYERDMREREEREALIREYREWDVEGNVERDNDHEE